MALFLPWFRLTNYGRRKTRQSFSYREYIFLLILWMHFLIVFGLWTFLILFLLPNFYKFMFRYHYDRWWTHCWFPGFLTRDTFLSILLSFCCRLSNLPSSLPAFLNRLAIIKDVHEFWRGKHVVDHSAQRTDFTKFGESRIPSRARERLFFIYSKRCGN